MQIIHTKNGKEGIISLGNLIGNSLKEGRNVLWIVSGGSNISISVEVMNMLQSFVAKKDIGKLTVMLSDERFGPVGHKDSNWHQLLDKGFNIASISVVPTLTGAVLNAEQIGAGLNEFEATKDAFSLNAKKAFNKADIIVGQLGMGADGHIAGILPHSRGVDDTSVAVAYEANDFKRITLTLKMIKKISVVFLFALGESKRVVVSDLETKDLPLLDMPAQILKRMKDVRVYCE